MKHVAVATPDLLAFDALGQSHRAGAALSRWKTTSVVSAAVLDVIKYLAVTKYGRGLVGPADRTGYLISGRQLAPSGQTTKPPT